MPESDLSKSAFWVWDDPQVNLLIGVHAGHAELYPVERYLSVGIGSSGVSQAEDVAGCLIWEGEFEWTKECLSLVNRSLKTHGW